MSRGWRPLGALAVLVLLLVGGCGSMSLQGIPLPGGADLGTRPFQVNVEFRDVLDLVPQASVKVNNVTVGQVKDITLDPKTWNAQVHVELNGDVKLPANSTAQLKQTTLLGEKYVELFAPTDQPAQGALADGATIPVERTNRFPEVEEIFGALSMLLNGGGLGHVQSIAHELNTALSGREGDTRALLSDLNTLVGTLDGQKSNITKALDGVDRLSASLVAQRDNLDRVLTDLQPGLAVLDQQRGQLVGLLKALDRLSGVATDVVNRSHDDVIADLVALRPTLRELAKTGDTLPRSLELLITPPFTDGAAQAVRGDHMNLDVRLDLNIQDLIDNLLNASTLPQALPDPLNNPLPNGLPNPLGAKQPAQQAPVPSIPGLLSKPDQSKNAPDSDSSLPGGLSLPGLGGR